MGQAFWLYGLLDVGYSSASLIRNFRANNFVLHKMAIKVVFICSVRLFVMYEVSNQLASWHILKNAKPILNRKVNDPRKEALVSRMNQF